MKKSILTILLILVLTLIVGCDNKTEAKNNKSNKSGTYEKTFWDQDGNGIEDWQEKEITLTYATWQYNLKPDVDATTGKDSSITIDTLMIDAFMSKYPNIKVEMQIIGEDYEWDTNIQAAAEVGNLPDVFLIYRLENSLPYKYLADITDYYNNDPDTAYIFDSVKNAGVYQGKRYAVPTFFYPEYWFVNLDILTNNGISKPSYGWTWDQMESIAEACYSESDYIIGQYGVSQYYRCLPKILSGDSSWQSYTFDGTKFNFDSTYMEQSFNKMTNALNTNALTNEYSADTLFEYYGDSTFDPTYNGYTAIWSAPSWEAKGFFDDMAFNWDVYPAPGGTINGNIDIAGVSATSENKAAAYQLLKWMSFGEEGLITRYELYADYKDMLFKSADNYPYPVADYGIDRNGDNRIWDNIPYDNVPGMTSPQMINAIKNAAIWGNKEVPGWDSANKAINEYFYQIISGKKTYSELKDTIALESNKEFTDFRELLDMILSGEIDPSVLLPEDDTTDTTDTPTDTPTE